MKKLLLVTLMAALSLAVVTETMCGRYSKNWGGSSYGYGFGGNCGRGSCEPAFQQCPPPPCCECDQTITVRVPPKMVCGWVCPDGTNEIPTSEARLVND